MNMSLRFDHPRMSYLVLRGWLPPFFAAVWCWLMGYEHFFKAWGFWREQKRGFNALQAEVDRMPR